MSMYINLLTVTVSKDNVTVEKIDRTMHLLGEVLKRHDLENDLYILLVSTHGFMALGNQPNC